MCICTLLVGCVSVPSAQKMDSQVTEQESMDFSLDVGSVDMEDDIVSEPEDDTEIESAPEVQSRSVAMPTLITKESFNGTEGYVGKIFDLSDVESKYDGVEIVTENTLGKIRFRANGVSEQLMEYTYNLTELGKYVKNLTFDTAKTYTVLRPNEHRKLYFNVIEPSEEHSFYLELSSDNYKTADSIALITEGNMIRSYITPELVCLEYKDTIEDNGKTIDICSAEGRDRRNNSFKCDLYIDRSTQLPIKLIKLPEGDDELQLTISFYDKSFDLSQEWIKSAKEGTEQTLYLYTALNYLDVLLLLSDTTLLKNTNSDTYSYDADLLDINRELFN